MEYLHEIENNPLESTAFPYSSSQTDVSSIHSQSNPQLQYSPLEKSPQQNKLSPSPNSKDIYIHDSSTGNESTYHYYPLTPPINQRSRSPSVTPSNFIRVHFPNKHTTAVCSSKKN